MNRQSSRPARGTLTGLAVAAITLAAACTPSNNVKPGAPVLTEVVIIENGGSPTVITKDTADCPTGTADQGGCDLTISLCRLPSASNWCKCFANPEPTPPPTPPMCDAGAPDAGTGGSNDDGGADAGDDASSSDDASTEAPPAPPPGTWSCAPFAVNSAVLFVFDRLLYTPPLDPGAAAGVTNIATATISPTPTTAITTSTDYASNGLANQVIFPLLGGLRVDGPSLLVSPQPELPANATVTIALDPTKVLAKDGKTPFAPTLPLLDGTITFTIGGFQAGFTAMPLPPDDGDECTPPLTDAVPDRTAVVATFNNPVDVDMTKTHIVVTATPAGGGASAPVAVEITSGDGLNFSIVPAGMANWPASSTIEVTIDATAADLVGDPLGAPATTSFTTSAM